jgi:deazaflavin-dependent oxidoreductase (nitroreductase family)
MSKQFQINTMTRLFGNVMSELIRLGLIGKPMYVLTVVGRKSGKPYSIPVSLVERDGQRWLVSPYGETNWVKNARAAGKVTLTRTGHSETLHIQELSPEESAPILKTYIKRESMPRPYFDVEPDAPIEEFVAEAPKHPVFRLVGV